MKILVTGATGFLGSSLVSRLLADGQAVRVLVRSDTKAALLAQMGAEPFIGDITHREVMRRAAAGADFVYHAVGRLHAPEVSEAEYYHAHVEGATTLLEVCRNEAGLQRLVYLSTTGVLGVTGDRPADEGAPYAPTNAYEDSKLQAELHVREAMRLGLPAVIVRPGMVYGPGDLHLLGFYRTIQRGLFRPIGAKPVWLSVIYIDDMVDALLCCGQHPQAAGECFHIAGPKILTLAELSAAIASALGKRPGRGRIPLPAARALALVGDLLPTRLRPLAPLTRGRLDFLTHSRVYNVEKSRRLLGFIATTDICYGIERTVAWYRQQGYLAGA